MDKLTEAIENLSQDDIAYLRSSIDAHSPPSQRQQLLKELLTVRGLHLLLSRLNEDEIAALYELWKSKTGLTFSELSKLIQTEPDAIEQIALNLQRKALVYILKNRKHLNNRLDKVYLYQPAEEILDFITEDDFKIRVHSLITACTDGTAKNTADVPKKYLPVLQLLFDAGGIASFSQIIESSRLEDAAKLLQECNEKELIGIHQTKDTPFTTLCIMNEKTLRHFIRKSEGSQSSTVNNRYNLLTNILHAYDIISSRGLYLTQQHDFRKADFKRISDALLPMYDHRGIAADPDDAARLCIMILNRMGSVSVKKDVVHIDLTHIEKDLAEPERFRTAAIKAALKKSADDTLFAPPYQLPSNEELTSLLDYLTANEGADFNVSRTSFILNRLLSSKTPKSRFAETGAAPGDRFASSLRTALFFGLVSMEGGKCRVASAVTEDREPSAYINPDFSIMIPPEDLPAATLYRVLSCTDVTKNDVVIHCKITKESVLAAHKRRMHPEKYLAELENHLRNGIPQNLLFMVREWIAQSLELSIQECVLVKVNHASFIDDMLTGSLKGAVIERISPTYAIVKRSMIDEIVKAGTKHNAIISLFSSTGE
jgi:hypothetical protein